MRYSSSILLVVVLVGCQGQPVPAPVAKKATVPLVNEPLAPELVALLEETNHEVALAKIDKMIQQQPDNGMLYSVRSSINHRGGRNEAAIADLDAAIAKNGTDARLFNNRGYVKLGLQMFKSATADFDRATELTPEYANPYNNRGLLLIAKGQYASAIEQLDQALVRDPNYVDAYNNRGFAALQVGNAERALADFNTAIKLNPKYVNAYNNRGLLRARVGDLDNAIVHFTDAMILDPMNPKYYEHRREVYLRKSAVDLALADETRHDWLVILEDLNSVIKRSAPDPMLHVDRARHYLSVHDQDKSLEDLNRALQLDPKCVEALLHRSQIRLEQKNFTGALEDAQQILASAPMQEASSLCGDAYLALKKYDKALECYAEARRIDSSVADAYYGKSQALQSAGKLKESDEALQLAIALNPSLLNSDDDGADASKATVPVPQAGAEEIAELIGHGQECIKRNDYKAALTDAEKLIEASAIEDGYSLCGDAYLGLKNFDKAIECYTKARRIDAADTVSIAMASQIRLTSGRKQADDGVTQAVGNAEDEYLKGSKDRDRAPRLVSKEALELLKQARECLGTEKYSEALKLSAQIEEAAPMQEAYSIRGDAYLGMKNFDKAIECYAKARRIDAAVAEAYFRRSQILKAAGQDQQASDSLKQAVTLDPEVAKRLR